MVLLCLPAAQSSGQVRVKQVDRGVYQPPTVTRASSKIDNNDDQPDAMEPPRMGGGPRFRKLSVEPTPLDVEPLTDSNDVELIRPASAMILGSTSNSSHAVLPDVVENAGFPVGSEDSWVLETNAREPYAVSSCDSCGSCDGVGPCDACCPSFPNARIRHGIENWFGSLELLLMFREGDLIPPLLSTGPNTAPDQTTLVGDEVIFDDMTAAGRVTIGTWLDDCQFRSLVFRLWSATEDEFDRAFDADDQEVLAIPFTAIDGTANSNLIDFPDGTGTLQGRFGTASVSASSNVYGGDVSVRQFWTGGLGTHYDVIYGYQYMRIDEQLALRTNSTITEAFSPTLQPGFTNAFQDHFETVNEFHGGQFGLSGRYREDCWSFHFLAKLGFGQVRREAELRGASQTTNGGPPVVPSDEGFFVRDSNSGRFRDSTFGWVPELNVGVGWQRYPRFDLTIGYHLIAMTDALEFSSVIDTTIDDTNNTRPTFDPSYDTYYVHGLNFGIRHVF